MMKSQTLKIFEFPSRTQLFLIVFVVLFCPVLWAKQEAMVITEKAVIYSDAQMTSPVGYIRRGKKITVGNIPRNKAQVFPIIVSGKIAYIRTRDVTTEKESMDSERLVAERFQKATTSNLRSKFAFDYFVFNSQIVIDQDLPLNKAALTWHGVSLRGEVVLKEDFDFQIITNFMTTSHENSKFNALEFGLGTGYRLIDTRKFKIKAEILALAVPFSSYAEGSDFRVNSYGYTLGAGLNLHYLFNNHWGMEVLGGVYRTALIEFDTPSPYQSISPVFTGNRLSFGVNYLY
jgi:hypothetical protein